MAVTLHHRGCSDWMDECLWHSERRVFCSEISEFLELSLVSLLFLFLLCLYLNCIWLNEPTCFQNYLVISALDGPTGRTVVVDGPHAKFPLFSLSDRRLAYFFRRQVVLSTGRWALWAWMCFFLYLFMVHIKVHIHRNDWAKNNLSSPSFGDWDKISLFFSKFSIFWN